MMPRKEQEMNCPGCNAQLSDVEYLGVCYKCLLKDSREGNRLLHEMTTERTLLRDELSAANTENARLVAELDAAKWREEEHCLCISSLRAERNASNARIARLKRELGFTAANPYCPDTIRQSIITVLGDES